MWSQTSTRKPSYGAVVSGIDRYNKSEVILDLVIWREGESKFLSVCKTLNPRTQEAAFESIIPFIIRKGSGFRPIQRASCAFVKLQEQNKANVFMQDS